MSIYSPQNNIRDIIVILFILGFPLLLSAQEPDLDKSANRGYIEYRQVPESKKGTVVFQETKSDWGEREEKKLTELQKQARMYRRQGLEMQNTGNLDTAMTLYQKAIELDPNYAMAYNDLGIIYEAKGLIDLAEENYLESIKIDPMFLSTYSNLALLYENKRDLEKAAFYWEKRAQLGALNDPWKQKARQRVADIRSVISKMPLEDAREQEVIGLMKDVAVYKSRLRKDNKALSQEHFEKAKRSYNKGDFVTAIKEALDAQYLDPANEEIEKFIEKAQTRALLR
jgi:Flp pilus assembly protein TadD